MKKLTFLFTGILCIFFQSIDAQSPKYGILFSKNEIPYKNQRKMFISFLKQVEENGEDTSFLRLDIDSCRREFINGKYKVLSINKKKDNFYIHKGRLKRKILYLIDIEKVDVDSALPKFVRIMSFKEPAKKGSEMIIGETYQLVLYYLIGIDYSKPLYFDGQEIYQIHGCPIIKESCFYKGIFIRFFDTQSYYYVESPNVKGLIYLAN